MNSPSASTCCCQGSPTSAERVGSGGGRGGGLGGGLKNAGELRREVVLGTQPLLGGLEAPVDVVRGLGQAVGEARRGLGQEGSGSGR